MRACNCCNAVMEQVGYCENCRCPESREMKPLRIFVSMGNDYDKVLEAVQECCTEDFVNVLLEAGAWEFEIEQNKSTQWWCIYITAEYEVWRYLECPALCEMRDWLDRYLDKWRGFKDDYENEQPEGSDLSEASSGVSPQA